MEEKVQLTEDEVNRRRRKSIALALILGALVLIILAVTYVKGPGIINRPL